MFNRFRTTAMVIIAVVIILVLSGCQGKLDGVSVTVETAQGHADVFLRDGRRLPPEEELVLSPSDQESYEVLFREDQPVRHDVDVLEVTVVGDPRGGEVGFRLGDMERTVSLEDVFRIDDTGWNKTGEGMTRIILPVPEWFKADGVIPEGATLTFRASRQYHVRELSFRPAPKTLTVATDGERRFDYRLPVEITEGVWKFHNISRLIAGNTDAVRLEYTYPPERFFDRFNRPAAQIDIGSIPIRWNLRPGTSRIVLRPALWHENGEVPVAGVSNTITVTLPSAGDFSFQRFVFPAGPAGPDDPVPVELTELSRYPQSAWRDDGYEIFSWSLYPDILWIDSRDYRVQSAFFKRLAFFVEKRGFIGTLLTNLELEGRHGYNAHNYRPEGLAAFFNAVEELSFPVNRYEKRLRDISADRGIIVRSEEGLWMPGTGGVLGVSRESYSELRRLLVIHEAMHGVFYMVEEFHRGVARYWRTDLTERERRYWQDMFAWMNYSPDDEYLMYNEFQAYLLQQSERGVSWYFRSRMADRVRNFSGRYEPVETFLREHPSTFEDAAAAVNELLFRSTGMVGGDPFCLVSIDG